MSIVINKSIFITKQQESTSFELRFAVPDHIQRIDIRYRYEKLRTQETANAVRQTQANLIDLSLLSADGDFIGGSGSNRSQVWVSEFDSSYGLAQLPIRPGEWAIIVGAYKIQPSGVRVEYEIELTANQTVLLKGDLHVHSRSSDGNLAYDEVITAAKKNGLDFLAVTDHNNYVQNYYLHSDRELTVIPGVEWSSFLGHACIWGLQRPWRGAGYANNTEEAQRILAKVQNNGAVYSINHPFRSAMPWRMGIDNFNYNCIEIWNGVMDRENQQCLEWWHQRLCEAKRIPIVGGSDHHYLGPYSPIGQPTTWVYSQSRGPTEILKAIVNGCSFVTRSPQAPTVLIKCGAKVMGEIVSYQQDLQVDFFFDRLISGDMIKIHSVKGEIYQKIIDDEISYQVSLPIKKEKFYYTTIDRKAKPFEERCLWLISNPLYLGGEEI
jgi:hypothetical protein